MTVWPCVYREPKLMMMMESPSRACDAMLPIR
jgi:hypothetical protein